MGLAIAIRFCYLMPLFWRRFSLPALSHLEIPFVVSPRFRLSFFLDLRPRQPWVRVRVRVQVRVRVRVRGEITSYDFTLNFLW